MPTKGPYPPNWKAIVAAVRQRSGDRCEALLSDGQRCGIANGASIHRHRRKPEIWYHCEPNAPCRGGTQDMDPDDDFGPQVHIMLTTMHLCQDSTCDDLGHLKHACNRCHLVYDAKQHARNAAATRRRRRIEAGQGAMTL